MSGFDPVRVIETLAEHGVEFVIIGGFAAELHGAPVSARWASRLAPRLTGRVLHLSAGMSSATRRIGWPIEGWPSRMLATSLADLRGFLQRAEIC